MAGASACARSPAPTWPSPPASPPPIAPPPSWSRRLWPRRAAPDGEPADRIPDRLWARLEARVAEREAAAEISLDITCPDCGAAGTFGFDVGAYFWAEVDADARRLLGEVAALAERFGWSEEALLAMPGSRRRAYLDLVRAT